MQHIARTAHRLQIDGIGWILLDLLPQPVDLDVDAAGALLRAFRCEFTAGHGRTGVGRERAEEVLLPRGEADGLRPAPQFATLDVEHERTEGHFRPPPRRLLLTA